MRAASPPAKRSQGQPPMRQLRVVAVGLGDALEGSRWHDRRERGVGRGAQSHTRTDRTSTASRRGACPDNVSRSRSRPSGHAQPKRSEGEQRKTNYVAGSGAAPESAGFGGNPVTPAAPARRARSVQVQPQEVPVVQERHERYRAGREQDPTYPCSSGVRQRPPAGEEEAPTTSASNRPTTNPQGAASSTPQDTSAPIGWPIRA